MEFRRRWKKITSQDLDESITDLKKILGKNKGSSRLYTLYDEQKSYIQKLRIIFSGFNDYLTKKKNLSQNLIRKKKNAVQTYLQEYHIGYSEVGLSELDSSDFTAFFEYFVAKKWFGITKSEFKALCPGLKSFVEFLKEKLNYYQKKSVYNNIIKALNSNLYYDLIFKKDEEDYVEDNDNQKDWVIKFSIGDTPEATDTICLNVGTIQDLMKKLEEISERKEFKNSIILKRALNQWYNKKEINIGVQIKEKLFNKYFDINKLNKNEIIAVIDYSLSDIFKKGYTQKQIAQRNGISVGKITNLRSLLSPYIPIEYFYPNYLSGELVDANLEKTYIFKIDSKQYRYFWAKFELLESHTLDDLHDTIQDIMDFSDRYEGHLYSFFLSGKEGDNDSEYSGPADFQDFRDTKKTTITLKELHLGYKQKFLYLYDYAESVKINIMLIDVGIQD